MQNVIKYFNKIMLSTSIIILVWQVSVLGLVLQHQKIKN
jgi:hypothetical protein